MMAWSPRFGGSPAIFVLVRDLPAHDANNATSATGERQ